MTVDQAVRCLSRDSARGEIYRATAAVLRAAIYVAVDDETYDATRVEASDATRDATYDATRLATRRATDAVIHDAIFRSSR